MSSRCSLRGARSRARCFTHAGLNNNLGTSTCQAWGGSALRHACSARCYILSTSVRKPEQLTVPFDATRTFGDVRVEALGSHRSCLPCGWLCTQDYSTQEARLGQQKAAHVKIPKTIVLYQPVRKILCVTDGSNYAV